MNKWIYAKTRETEIIEHENRMFRTYLDLLKPYVVRFGELGCQLDVQMYWMDGTPGRISLERLPFTDGYVCSISCQVLKNEKLVLLDEEEGFSATCDWNISSVRRTIKHLVVTLCEDTDDIGELDTYLNVLR